MSLSSVIPLSLLHVAFSLQPINSKLIFLFSAHFFVSLSLGLLPSSFYLLSPSIPPVSLFIASSPSPSTLFLGPRGLRLPAVDYHTSKEPCSLGPVGPISCRFAHQSSQAESSSRFHMQEYVFAWIMYFFCLEMHIEKYMLCVDDNLLGLGTIAVLCVTKDSLLLWMHPII